MKSLFYTWLILQLILCGVVLGDTTYRAEHCLLEDELKVSQAEAMRIGGVAPIPIIVGGLMPKMENRNCK